jgi:hypothetical protein
MSQLVAQERCEKMRYENNLTKQLPRCLMNLHHVMASYRGLRVPSVPFLHHGFPSGAWMNPTQDAMSPTAKPTTAVRFELRRCTHPPAEAVDGTRAESTMRTELGSRLHTSGRPCCGSAHAPLRGSASSLSHITEVLDYEALKALRFAWGWAPGDEEFSMFSPWNERSAHALWLPYRFSPA